MDANLKEKNKIDLKYNTYLQFFNSVIIVGITIIIAVLIAIATNQIEIGKNIPFVFVATLSITTVIFAVIGLIILYNKMSKSIEELNKL